MDLLKEREFKGLFFEILNEKVQNDDYYRRLKLIVRVYNFNDKKKKIALDLRYISVFSGMKDSTCWTMGFGSGRFLQSNAFVDVEMTFDDVTKIQDGDRIEFEINEGRIAALLLTRENDQWYIVESKDTSSISKQLKTRIEHFESIEEQFGLALQHFSVKVIDDTSLKLFCEVLALNDDVIDTGFTIEIAIYDLDYNIIYRDERSKDAWEFKGFEVFEFNVKDLDISIEEIGRIRFYPSK